jgi:hypothetical protein
MPALLDFVAATPHVASRVLLLALLVLVVHALVASGGPAGAVEAAHRAAVTFVTGRVAGVLGPLRAAGGGA